MDTVRLFNISKDTGLFDKQYYEISADKHFSDEFNAFEDYVLAGWKRLFDPSNLFDTSFYLETYPDVLQAGINPLVHFIEHGRGEKRSPRLGRAPLANPPEAPSGSFWYADNLAEIRKASPQFARPQSGETVDVVIPVYRGFRDTLCCLHSVIVSKNKSSINIIVIDDVSPEKQLSDFLLNIARSGIITLIRNESNLGFVGSVNKGMQTNHDRDVILLNSDTCVYGDWVDRMRAHHRTDPNIATVTPFSNNATIFSYPHSNRSNNHALDIDYSDLDRMISGLFCNESAVDMPTAVGFCMFISRASLDALGVFNEAMFGKGYGEENDFCFRVRDAGLRNVIAPNVFVRHTGEVSFSASSVSGKKAAGRRLLSLHPRYDRVIADHVARDPLKSIRSRIDLARFGRWSDGRAVLMVEHGWGGGIQRSIEDLQDLLAQENVPTITMRPDRDGNGVFFQCDGLFEFPNLPSVKWDNIDEIVEILTQLHLSHVHIHSLVGYPTTRFSELLRCFEAVGLQYYFSLHDYVPVCPRITMIDASGTYCNTPSSTYCQRCIDNDGSNFGFVNVDDWRASYVGMLSSATALIAPSFDVIRRVSSIMNEIDTSKFLLRPHPRSQIAESSLTALERQTDLVIGIIGAIGEHKGSRVLELLALDAIVRKLPIKFILYGYSNRKKLSDLRNVEVTGEYSEHDINAILKSRPCHFIFYPSLWPETFSFTLDIAFRTGLLPVAFDIGAPAFRIKAAGRGVVLPLALAYDPSALNDELMAVRNGVEEIVQIEESGREWKGSVDYYAMDRSQ